MTDKKLYDGIRGMPGKIVPLGSETDQLKRLVFDECNAKQKWKRRAGWLAEQLAKDAIEDYEDGHGHEDSDECKAEHWLRRAEEEA